MDTFTQEIIGTKVQIAKAQFFQKINNKMNIHRNKIVK